MMDEQVRDAEGGRVLGRFGTPLTAAAIGAVALLLLNPPQAAPISAAEARWLHEAASPAARLIDLWVGGAAGDALLRAPIVLLALLAVGTIGWVVARRAGFVAGALAGTAAAAEQFVHGGDYRAGTPAVLAFVIASASILLAFGRPSLPIRVVALALLAGISAALDGGLAALPAGLAIGAAASTRSRLAHGTLLKIAAAAPLAVLTIAILLHRDFAWSGESGGRGAARLQMLALVLALGVLAAGAWLRAKRGAISDGCDGRGGPVGEATGRAEREPLWIAIGGAFVPLVWVAAGFDSDAARSALIPLLFGAGALALAGIAPRLGAVESWSPPKWRRPRAAVALVLAIPCVLSWSLGRPRAAQPLPLPEAMSALRDAKPGLRELIVGAGLSPGVVRHAAHGTSLRVVDRPEDPEIGSLGLAAPVPSMTERKAIAARLAERVLDRYGIAAEDAPGRATVAPALRWSLFRPVSFSAASDAPRPDIAIVSIDTLRADHLSLYGYSRSTSPRIAQWARTATVYDHACAAAPSTAPSFGSLMTGRLAVAHGVRKNYELLDPGHWTLARILARAGYDTAAFVSSYVLSAENCGLDLGFASYDQTLGQLERNRADRPIRLAPELRDAVTRWIGARATTAKPWFLWVHAIDPHGPYTPLPEFAGTFRGTGGRVLARDQIPEYQWLGSADYDRYVDAYDAEILQTDRYIGELLEALDALPAPRGRIVIFVADHGEALGEHDVYFDHGRSLHREEIQVPLIIKETPDGPAVRIGAEVSTLDLLPTILDRLRIRTDLPYDGLTLPERLATGAPVLANWMPGEVMAVGGGRKLMVRSTPLGAPVSEVYDLASDPQEQRPLGLPPEPPGAVGAAGAAGASGSEADRSIAALVAAAHAILTRDPLSRRLGTAIDREQWQLLDSEAREKLESLGYAAP